MTKLFHKEIKFTLISFQFIVFFDTYGNGHRHTKSTLLSWGFIAVPITGEVLILAADPFVCMSQLYKFGSINRG